MDELSALRKEIRDLLVERIGVLSDSDQVRLKQHAQHLGMDNRQFSFLLQEIHLSINWSALRDQQEGPDRVLRPIHIFGAEVRSLEKLGEVLFGNRVKAIKYLEDGVFLKENVTYLSHQNVDLAMDMMELHAGDQDAERRFLRVCYQLNSRLPFRIGVASFSTVVEILERGWINHDFFLDIYRNFSIGHLQIWIYRLFPELASLLPSINNFPNFLSFLYDLNSNYPFYVGKELFLQPGDIVSKARKAGAFWKPLLASIDDNLLVIWLERKGMGQLMSNFKIKTSALRAVEKPSDDLSMYLVQKFLEALEPEVEVPSISVSVDKVSFLSIQAKPLLQPIVVSLETKGYVRVTVGLDRDIPGITVSKTRFSLSDLHGEASVTLYFNVDPSKLIKNNLYTLSIIIHTDYQLIKIPVSLKTVFPVWGFALSLLKYGLLGAIFFGMIRLLVATASPQSGWLLPELAWDHIVAQVPINHAAYIFIFILAVVAPFLIWPRIKKIEQL